MEVEASAKHFIAMPMRSEPTATGITQYMGKMPKAYLSNMNDIGASGIPKNIIVQEGSWWIWYLKELESLGQHY
ncbi:MAG: hypothetical protein QXS32_04650 [Candidatus Nezhaarchaeales archaeon]